MKEVLKSVGSGILGWSVLFGLIVLATMCIKGGAWLCDKVLPISSLLSGFSILICAFVLLPLAAFRKTRWFSAIGLFFGSYFIGMNWWIMGLLIAYSIWGAIGVLAGVLVMGIGVVPVAVIAALFTGSWPELLTLVVGGIFTFGVRHLAVVLMRSCVVSEPTLNNPIGDDARKYNHSIIEQP